MGQCVGGRSLNRLKHKLSWYVPVSQQALSENEISLAILLNGSLGLPKELWRQVRTDSVACLRLPTGPRVRRRTRSTAAADGRPEPGRDLQVPGASLVSLRKSGPHRQLRIGAAKGRSRRADPTSALAKDKPRHERLRSASRPRRPARRRFVSGARQKTTSCTPNCSSTRKPTWPGAFPSPPRLGPAHACRLARNSLEASFASGTQKRHWIGQLDQVFDAALGSAYQR